MILYKKNITSDELKTIAVTSAIAAAGTAVATALVTYALDRWIFKDEEVSSSEPTFIVVPVVDHPIPPLPETPEQPMIAGLGELSDQQKEEIRRLAPWRYWHEFYRCYEKGDPAYMTADCKTLNDMYASMSQEDREQLNDIVTSSPYVGKTESVLYLMMAGGVGIAAGILIGSSIA